MKIFRIHIIYWGSIYLSSTNAFINEAIISLRIYPDTRKILPDNTTFLNITQSFYTIL